MKIKTFFVVFSSIVFSVSALAQIHFKIHNAAMSPKEPIDLWLHTIGDKQYFFLNDEKEPSGYWSIEGFPVNRLYIMHSDTLFGSPTQVEYNLYLKESPDPNSKDIKALVFARGEEFTRFYEGTGYKVKGYVIDKKGKAIKKELNFTSKSPDGVTITAPRKQ